MIQEFKKVWKPYTIGLLWLLGLLWPLLGIHPDGTLSFGNTFTVWLYIAAGTTICLLLYIMNKSGSLNAVSRPLAGLQETVGQASAKVPNWVWIVILLAAAFCYPFFTGRYAQDVATNVLIYVCLGLGLNVVVGLAGMLDLGYIAFYGVGAYTYALLNIHFGMSFWICLPFAAAFALTAGCIIGYPTLRMRGDYLAIVTLGFGEIVRILLNNWMSLTNGPNGLLGVKPPSILIPSFQGGISFEVFYLKKLHFLYYIALALAIVTIIAVRHLNFSRIGRAWESIREDETAAELMGVNTFKLKLLAYAMGALFAGLAGAFFCARMRFVSPESFTFLESAMVLSMVVLGGMGSIPGIILGAAALIVLPEVFREFETYRMLVFGMSMVVMMLFRPAGLIPAKRMGKRGEEGE
ncbi:high-affinity branched-chain amino acid ABC transporter permease LivM [Desulfosarcina sp.]|uniref:high-affinity branched-chain amino acid ABC transporter permease LivM n=1 Tax=Desulfosarcina sp. TaxID=2027861 RepID=UPI0029A95C6B|nr:high-affinity branched-chain amino acid ABC transporter permease LivM [Desulfosarcina sp.]MDX2454302.1 high-affinity branched-chain amino acid ABC transporter permease LivM [Desulfosarcina sp.]MDX2491970.1 high-affinity branched-chain amino acid ABC transporter permease LivM [Desulfosarcina sp.]